VRGGRSAGSGYSCGRLPPCSLRHHADRREAKAEQGERGRFRHGRGYLFDREGAVGDGGLREVVEAHAPVGEEAGETDLQDPVNVDLKEIRQEDELEPADSVVCCQNSSALGTPVTRDTASPASAVPPGSDDGDPKSKDCVRRFQSTSR